MSTHLGLTAARMHGVLAIRPGSTVFHIYAGPRSRRTGRIPRGARPVGNCRTRQLRELERDGSVLDLAGRRLCGRCSARLSAVARRAEQPVSRDACLAFYSGITLADLVVATVMTSTVDETHRVGFVLGLLFGQAPVIRPRDPAAGDGAYRVRVRQAMFDLHAEIVRRRRALVAAARSPEEIEIAARIREDELARDQRILSGRRKAAALDRAIDRRNAGQYLMPHERQLLDSA